MQPVIIDAQHLSCKSGKSYIIQDINWQVKKGEHWIVFGVNGCGKTTLLSTVTGFQKYTHGQLNVFGQPYSKQNIIEHRKRIGWVSGSFFDKYYHHEQVLTIVLSGLTGTLNINGQITDQDIVNAKKWLNRFDLLNKQDMPYDFLSKGQRQNVLLARALIADPDILILDEPASGLDVLSREKMLNLMENMAIHTNKTFIYVTHYLEEILPAFDHALLLKNGKVFDKGDTTAIFTDENLTNFLDHPVHLLADNDHRMRIKLLERSDKQ